MRLRTTKAAVTLLCAAAVTLTACGTSADSPSSPPPARETSPRPDLPTASADPTPAPTHYARDDTERFVPESSAQANDDGTAGSGCTPGLGEVLPDGVWRGFVVDGDIDRLEFDLICSWHFTSERFRDKSDELGEDGTPAIYVTENSNPMTRDLPLADDVAVWPHPPSVEPLEIEEFYVQRLQGGWDEVWLFVNDERVTEISQVYYP